MREEIEDIKEKGFDVVACCCGHGRYSKTMVIRESDGQIFDGISMKPIPRVRRFYKKDRDGYLFIPEVDDELTTGLDELHVQGG